MITGFFNLYKPRKFNHRFIYYDPIKEALKERLGINASKQ